MSVNLSQAAPTTIVDIHATDFRHIESLIPTSYGSTASEIRIPGGSKRRVGNLSLPALVR